MQVSISVLAGIVGDVHNVMGDIWKTCLSILNIIDGTSYLYRKELSSILKQDIKIDKFIIEYNLFPISIDL